MTAYIKDRINRAKIKYNNVKCQTCKHARSATSLQFTTIFICKNKQCKDYGK